MACITTTTTTSTITKNSKWLSVLITAGVVIAAPIAMKQSSIVKQVTLLAGKRNHPVFLHRDDQRFVHGDTLSGNKSRKFYKIGEMGSQFPRFVASYGGAQSNSMLALARLVHHRSPTTQYYYFTKQLPSFLKNNPTGSLALAMSLGMKVCEISKESYETLVQLPKEGRPFPSVVLSLLTTHGHILTPELTAHSEAYWIPQGGAMGDAEVGVEALVKEIIAELPHYATSSSFRSSAGASNGAKKWKLVIASGTGTMALYAARHMSSYSATVDCEVVAVPCVGDGADLMAQMTALDAVSGCDGVYPTVLGYSDALTAAYTRRSFGKPYSEHLSLWRGMREQGVEFDLVYAPRALELLAESFALRSSFWNDSNVLYYHCGGVEGNASQLGRYNHAGLL